MDDKTKKLLIKSKHINFDKWGKDINHNILYITGPSGSGKSTMAQGLADKNTNVIHLDLYFEHDIEDDKLDSDFVKYARSKIGKDYKISLWYDGKYILELPDDKRKLIFKRIDKFINVTEEFGREQFTRGKKVIIEGTQIMDGTAYPDTNILRNKCLIVLSTNPLTSFFRRISRDNETVKDIFKSGKGYVGWYNKQEKYRNSLKKITNVSTEEKVIKDYIKNKL